MKIDFAQKLLNLEGRVLKEVTANEDGSRGPDRDLTLRAVSIAALNTVFPDEKNIGFSEKDERFALQLKIYSGDMVDLDAKEVSKIQELIAKMPYTPLLVGQAARMLDNKDSGLGAKPLDPSEPLTGEMLNENK